MKRRLLALLFVLIAVAVGFWLASSDDRAPVLPAPVAAPAEPPPVSVASEPPSAPPPAVAAPGTPEPAPLNLPPRMSEPGSAQVLRANPPPRDPLAEDPAQQEAEALALNIRQYMLRFGGNPVGTNSEIVKQLNGENLKSARYLPAELLRLSDQGELLDRWGTPYFFHQESAEKMEVRSAGPDRKLYTTDDHIAQ